MTISGSFNPETLLKPEMLLVEDSRTISLVLRHRLEMELGLAVTTCRSLSELRQTLLAKNHFFALAVVDLTLPGSPHGEALDLTIEHRIPSIVFAASVNTQLQKRVLDSNAIDYIVKDNVLSFDSLVGAVRRLLLNRKTRILVVGAPGEAYNGMLDLLASRQYAVAEAASGEEALLAIESQKDISLAIVVGGQLPDTDSYTLTSRICGRSTVDPVRVIGMAGAEEEAASVRFLRAGATDFLHSSFTADELQQRIVNVLQLMGEMKQLRAAAACDYLTGLYNRRYLYDNGPRIINDCLRRNALSSVAILDIDHFKRLNDTYGHEIGDLVLKAVASRLSELFKDSDYMLSRLGGEEFAILFPMMNSLQASKLCDEICLDISKLKVQADDEELSVTVSIGVAEISEQETFENYLNAADQFLYMAKHRGRNNVFSDARMTAEVLA